ncbi:MAG TPA: DsbA family protein [Candidatus Angelobacter sp.]|jgi:predicted DsbA family dithiol-disulfide isomerase|nr:DsbA family protein [Candidatus Angelobacter sp.]
MSTPTTTVSLHVDPACPWAWLTSRWLAEVEKVRPVRVVTHLLDLAEINRGKEAEDRLERSHSAGERALRVLVLVQRELGADTMARVYTEIGEAYHERSEPLGELSTLRSAVQAAGLDPSLADRALDDESTYEELLALHRKACEVDCFGVPTLQIEDSAPIFGPVVDRRVTGEEAGELWDHTAWLIEHGFFFELKRTRTHKAQIGRYRVTTAA